MKEVFIVDFQRTPVGKYGGLLSGIRPDDLAAATIAALMQRNETLPATDVDEVIFGCANQSGEDNRNVARFASLLGGLPITVPAYTVNRLCASGMQSVMNGFAQIMTGAAEVVIAGGVESMSRAPYVIPKAQKPFDRGLEIVDTTLGSRFMNPKMHENYGPYSMGETGENVAERWQVNRERQDAFALQSHEKYFAAWNAGKFNEELIAAPEFLKKEMTNPIDEGARPGTSLEKLAALKPVFREGGSLTAGNSSGINDGASAILLASGEAVKRYGLKPIAKIIASASAGVHPDIMGTGPIPATQKLLKQTGLSVADIDLFEINEAYAVQVLVCADELGIEPEKLNVNGGAIAIGHPLGTSGNRITGHLALELRRRNARYGIATMCVGVGQGTAILIENLTQS
ncbi:thiolase family protein [Taibaiella soli]|uniref:3-oxoadipyl-CoA thiolase n=1 Tax=Taibaiella soli TaxID=1649169 RepID=A0A2W2AR52_9BACT|nr:thiolase family protein [Taibaiella soli]PZF74930.1 3-oxoadipyl-CoA thiolase [Taibaiella soli]